MSMLPGPALARPLLPRRALLSRTTSALAASSMLLGGSSFVRADGEVLPKTGGYMQFCEEDTMKPKAHGTSMAPVQDNLRWNVDGRTADRICSFNRHYAEYAGYWETTSFLSEVSRSEPTVYYDSVTGKPLFVAPIGRSMAEFLSESKTHGWPSFRDEEVVWENMRVLKTTGEAVSADGTHLGHNLPDAKGNRYCIKCAREPPDRARSAPVSIRAALVGLADCACVYGCAVRLTRMPLPTRAASSPLPADHSRPRTRSERERAPRSKPRRPPPCVRASRCEGDRNTRDEGG